jgi:hypothetical protein
MQVRSSAYTLSQELFLPIDQSGGSGESEIGSHLSSMAFFTRPFFRFAKVACLERSSLILAILIFLRPISAPRPLCRKEASPTRISTVEEGD